MARPLAWSDRYPADICRSLVKTGLLEPVAILVTDTATGPVVQLTWRQCRSFTVNFFPCRSNCFTESTLGQLFPGLAPLGLACNSRAPAVHIRLTEQSKFFLYTIK
ncbi:hypothetical protein BDV09DRAFT_77810 [Aspergillus tetrazonus]